MNKIIKHLKENWIRHGFETLAVLIGVLAAFELNNWNEKRKQEILEIQYLGRLISDLAADTAYYQNRIRQESQALARNNEFIDNLYKTQENKADVQELLRLMHPGTNPLTTHNPSYLELSRSGNLSIFQNQELKASMTDYYRQNEDLGSQVDEFNLTTNNLLTDVILIVGIWSRYTGRINDDRKVFNDEEWLFLNNPGSSQFQSLESLASTFQIRNTEFIGHFEKLETKAKELIIKIDKELQNRN